MAATTFVWEIGNFKWEFLKTHTCNNQTEQAIGPRIDPYFEKLTFQNDIPINSIINFIREN
jgi:hypothetical protein